MNDKNTKKLFKDFKFLKKKNIPNGIECNDGWFNVLNNLFTSLKSLSDIPDNFIVTRVYNRHGILDIHTKNGNNSTRLLIEMAKEESELTCDQCGNNKEMQSCDSCKEVEDNYVLDLNKVLQDCTDEQEE